MSQWAVKWIFILDKDFVFNVRNHLPTDFSQGCAFVDRAGQRRLELHPNGDAKVLAGYSWDGCTPKFAVWDIVVGTPDCIPNNKTTKSKAYYASLFSGRPSRASIGDPMAHQRPRLHPGLLSCLLLGLVCCQTPLVSRAHTRAPAHTCCTWEIEHCSMGGVRPGLPAECSAGHRSTGVDCDSLCCVGHVFSDQCPGFIIDRSCSRGFEDSTARDSDGDGLNDSAETCGIDTNFDGVYDLDLPAMGANPQHKDLFLELDWMPGQSTTRAGVQAMRTAFAAAPIGAGGVNNPDGLPGINLWVDTGTLSDPTAREDGAGANSCGDGADNGIDGLTDGADPDCLVGDNLGGGNQMATANICDHDIADFTTAKNANFAAGRGRVFRYAISAVGCDEDADGLIDSGGSAEIGGNDFIEYNHDGGTIMHELGHTLNLRHGGDVNANCKPNYVSVMNYDQQFGIPQPAGVAAILDYSPPRFAGGRGAAPLPQLVENNLNENTILDATDAANRFIFVNTDGNKVQTPLNLNPNYNIDVDPPREAALTANIDNASAGPNGVPAGCRNTINNSTLVGFDDWTNIRLDFKPFPDSADGVFAPDLSQREPTLRELLDLRQAINTTDLSVVGAVAFNLTVADVELTYNIGVENLGPNPAATVALELDLPPDTTLVASPPGCSPRPGGLLCTHVEILASRAAGFPVRVKVASDFVGALPFTARVSHAGPDPALANNTAVITADDDNDGCLNWADDKPKQDSSVIGRRVAVACPDSMKDVSGWDGADSDGDGKRNCADTDDDGDGIPDTSDSCPVVPGTTCIYRAVSCPVQGFWDVCQFGGCNELLIKILSVINPDPGLIVQNFWIQDQSLIILPTVEQSVETIEAAMLGEATISMIASQRSAAPTVKIEIWSEDKQGKPGKLVAKVAEYSPRTVAKLKKTGQSALVVSVTKNGSTISVQKVAVVPRARAAGEASTPSTLRPRKDGAWLLAVAAMIVLLILGWLIIKQYSRNPTK